VPLVLNAPEGVEVTIDEIGNTGAEMLGDALEAAVNEAADTEDGPLPDDEIAETVTSDGMETVENN